MSNSRRSPIVAVTPGDPQGIGPEIIKKLYSNGTLTRNRILLIGAIEPLRKLKIPLEVVSDSDIPGIQRGKKIAILPSKAPKKLNRNQAPGFHAGWSVKKAIEFANTRKVQAIATGPISKERINQAGFRYSGHTEMIEKLLRQETTMMLANPRLRVSLVTTHIAISRVSQQLNKPKIKRAIRNTVSGLQEYWKIRKPRLAVLGLNPHCGENGLMGNEEKRIISPAIAESRRAHRLAIEGPFPADTFFAEIPGHYKKYDAVIAMYHDQGLIPVKAFDMKRTVNITLGTRIIRTSVDHGVGFDIAGRGKADPSSFEAAIKEAFKMTRHIK